MPSATEQVGLNAHAGSRTPAWVVEACHAKGAAVMSIVDLAKHARSAIRNGTDIVIVQGAEGGGHTAGVPARPADERGRAGRDHRRAEGAEPSLTATEPPATC